MVEPLAYLCYNGRQFAMTATEAALYDQVVNGNLRVLSVSYTHLYEQSLGQAQQPDNAPAAEQVM